MPNYDKPMVAIYMYADDYKKFRDACDDKMFQKLAISNIRCDHKIQKTIKQQCNNSSPCDFMLEIPKPHFDRVLNIIKTNGRIQFFSTDSHNNSERVKHIATAIEHCNGCYGQCLQTYKKTDDKYIASLVSRYFQPRFFSMREFSTANAAVLAAQKYAHICNRKKLHNPYKIKER